MTSPPTISPSTSVNSPHPLLGYSEFVLDARFDKFWRTTWGKPRNEVFAKLSHRDKEYEYLSVLPPKNSNPEFNNRISNVTGILMCSEYGTLWRDLTSELEGIETGSPTLPRPDPSPWDQMNEHLGKPWHDGHFHNDDGSPVLWGDWEIQGDTIEDGSEGALADGPLFRVFQIIGQSGIGKSMSLYIVLALRLMDSKPTFLQTQQGEAHFFCSSGTYKVALPERPSWGKKLTVQEMLLFDSDAEVAKPDNFWSYDAPIPIVEACSPRDERTRWCRKMSVTRWYMRPMSLAEFLAASTLQSQSLKMEQELLEQCYNTFGPNAREAYDYCGQPDGILQYESDIVEAIKSTSSNALRAVLLKSSYSYDTSLSHHLMLVTAGPTRYLHRAGLVTNQIYELVRNQYESDKDCRIIDLFSVFCYPETCVSAGYIFKDTMHRILKRGMCLEVWTMSDTNTGTKNRLYDTNMDYPTQWLRIGDVVELLENQVATGPLPSDVFGRKDELLQGVYCQPLDSNTAAFDAYFWSAPEKTIWMFQFTVSKEHDAKHSGLQWIKERAPDDIKIKIVVFSPQKTVRLAIQKTSPNVDAVYHVYMHDIEALAQGH
ncbi:hypothetical protein VKT23_016031 [Stygiomarasmius scandens]|uniref:Uncharacterized protein n=1 Tax=Marasmiellus scandens TaxID=2682957 RepID=A0ABR1IW68_9AGAR